MGFGPVITLSLFIFGLMTCGTATTFFHIFPVPANPISFRPCHGICILSCGCVGVSVRRYCCGFRSMSLKIGYRTLNCIIHFWSLILVSVFFRLGSPQNLFQVIFVAVILSTHSYLEFVGVGGYIVSVFFVCRNGITEFAKTGQVSDDTINLINY